MKPTATSERVTVKAADPARVLGIVRDLNVLIQKGAKFSAIYADLLWPYQNTAALGVRRTL